MKKPLYLLLAVLVLFVLIYLLLLQKEKKTFSPSRVENFLGLDSALVDRIEFTKFDTKMIFRRINQQWHVVQPDSYRADNVAVGQLLGLASHLAVGEIISSNREKQILFQVDSLTGTGLDFFSGDRQLASVVVGKLSDDYLHAYLRKTRSEDVYLAEGVFTSITKQRVDKWRDRRILTFDPKQVNEIELSQGKERFKLTREDTLWRLSPHPYRETTAADYQKAEDYVRLLADMKSDNFPREGEAAGLDFEQPELAVQLTFLDGHSVRLLAVKGQGDPSRYFVKTDQDNTVFILFEYSFKRLAQELENFQTPPEEP